MEENAAIVKLLVEADPTDKHIRNNEGKTPMYIAVEQGYNHIVEIISATCTAPSRDGPNGSTAVPINNPDPVKSPRGTLYKIMDRDAMYAAAIAGDADAIANLEMKAEIVNDDQETILHVESQNGNTEHVRFILREFTNKNLLAKHTINKHTALHLAIYSGGPTEVAELLIDAARHLASSSPNDSNHDSSVNSFQAFLRQGDKDMDTALHAAVMEGNIAIVKLLVEADPTNRHTQNSKGKTPTYIAAEKGRTDIVKAICKTCTAPSLDGPGGSTALHAAVKNCNHDIEVVEVLLKAAKLPLSENSFQAFLRQGDKDLDTALHAAVMEGNTAIVKLLVEADPTYRHTKNSEGKTPTYLAAEKGRTDIVRAICTTCTAPSLYGPGGSTALHAAVKNHNHDTEVVEVLIDAATRLTSSASDNDNMDANGDPFSSFLRRVDEDLNSALHIAVMKHNLATAKRLLEADPSYPGTKNNKGQTPFYAAVERGYADIAKMICTTSTTAPFYVNGPGGCDADLHAVIKNLDEAKNEVRDVMKMIINVFRDGWFLHGSESVGLRKVYRTFADDFFGKIDEYGQTILQVTVELNYVAVVELLLDEQDPAYDLFGKGFITLMPLIYKAKDKDYKDMVKLLSERYEAGAELATRLKPHASLISAIRNRQAEKVFSLLDHDHASSLVSFVDNLGWSALHHAAYHEFESIIYAIVQAQKTSAYNIYNFEYGNMVSTPFHVAAERGYSSIVILLLQLWPSSSSAYTNIDKNGQNILHLAALKSKKDMVQGILNYCPDEHKDELVNKQDNDGNTPLHLLIKRGCFVSELLRYEGVNTMVENNKRCVPADMLYVEDQIIDDQVKIKVALDYIQIDYKKDIFSSSVFSTSNRERKNVNFKKKAQQMRDEKLARMKEDTRALANCLADAIAGDPICRAAMEMEADTLNEAGETILHVESKKGVVENVRFIVSALANKNLLVKLDNEKQTALYLAVDHGHIQVVEALLDVARRNMPSSSANDDTHNPVTPFQTYIRQPNVPDQNTALHVAVLNGDIVIVKLLVEADPNGSHVQNNEGKTPIYIAAEKGYKDIVKEMCTTCTALSLDGPGGRTTALHALIQNIGQVTEGAVDVIRMIIHAAKRRSSVEFEALFSRRDESGSIVLQLAVERNFVEVVRLILQEDPAYQHGREIKRNGLMRLIYKAIDNGCSDDIVKLLSQTYQVGIIPHHKGAVDLILAIKRLDEDSVSSLLEDSKDLVTYTEDNGWTPLHYAAYHEFDSVLEAIIQAQEEVGHPFVYGNMVSTPFDVAVKHGYTSTLLQLMELWPDSSSASLDANSPFTAVNKDGQNILHLAAADNNKEMVQGILKYCPEKYKSKILKHHDINGDTPLHLLISHGCFIPELIKHKGLDTMAKNKKDFTPRDMLYVKDDIVADQVHIKIALDSVQPNQSVWKLWPKRTEKKTDAWKSNKISQSKRKKKDGKFEEGKKLLMDAKHEQMKKDLERYKMRTNTQIIVTALITTVTFTVGFTMPGGLYQSGDVNEGLVVLSRKTAFNAFMLSDALALLLSTSSLFFYFLESMNEDPRQVSKLNAASTVLNIVSVMAMMLTFIAGTYVVLSHSPALAIGVSIIGSLFFLLIIVLSIKIVYDRKGKRNED